jgi:hypothetical protein
MIELLLISFAFGVNISLETLLLYAKKIIDTTSMLAAIMFLLDLKNALVSESSGDISGFQMTNPILVDTNRIPMTIGM